MEGNEKGQSHSLDRITYGSTVKENEREKETKQKHPEKPGGKNVKKEVIKCVKAPKSQGNENLKSVRFRNMLVTGDLSENTFNGEWDKR